VLSLLLVSVALAQDPEPASATDPDQARAAELFENGARLYGEGAYEASIVAFRESLRLSGSPALHYNIANALERLGDLEGAREELNAYRALAPADEQESLERRLAALERRIEEERAKEEARAAPVAPAPVPAAQPAPAPVAVGPSESSSQKKHPRWSLVVAGGAIAALGGAGAGISYGNANTAESNLDRAAYDRARTINTVSWTGVGIGAGVALLGVALPVSSPVHATPSGLGVRF